MKNIKTETNNTLNDFIAEKLLMLGFRVSLKGFDQLRECVVCYMQNRNQNIMDVYKTVGKKFNVNYTAIERNLRKSIGDVPQVMPRLSSLFRFNVPLDFYSNKDFLAIFTHYVLTNYNSGLKIS